LLGFHCSQKHPGGNRVFAGFLWRCTSPTWKFIHKLCTGLRASIVDKLEAGRSPLEHRANPAISGSIVPFREPCPWTNIGQAEAPALSSWGPNCRVASLGCSLTAQSSCLMKRPAGPLGCRVIFWTAQGTCNQGVESHRPDADNKATGAAGRNRTCDPLLRREMLYPLSYSRAVSQCIKGRRPSRAGRGVHGLPKPTKLHKFQACEDTLYRGTSSILSLVRRRHGDDAATSLEARRRQTWVRNSRLPGCWPWARSPVH
jgi:hypothetical protein